MASISLYNASTVVKDEDLQKMCDAMQAFDPTFASTWGITPTTFTFVPNGDPTQAPNGTWIFVVIDDDQNVPGALAFHSEDNDIVDAFILAKTVLDNGGTVMSGPNSVSTALHHEVLEALIDPTINAWWDVGKTFAAEVCDPVQSTSFDMNGVSLSNFVTPNWRDNQNTTGPFDYLNELKAPGTLLDGGYAIYRTAGQGTETQTWGRSIPGWVVGMKFQRPNSRTRRRLK